MKKIWKALGIALILACAIILTACDGLAGHTPAGEVVSRDFEMPRFDEVNAGGQWEVIFRQSANHSVSVEMQESMFDILQMEVQGGTLQLGFDRPVLNAERHVITVYAPFLAGISLGGQAIARDWDGIAAEDFFIIASGQAQIYLGGAVENLDIDAGGQAGVFALGLRAAEVDIIASGQSIVEVFATHELDVEISGQATVRYMGSPRVEQRISSQGRLERVD